MANKNRDAIDKIIRKTTLQGFQLLTETNPKNYTKFIYGGYIKAISQFSGKDFADLVANLEKAKTDAEIQACMSGTSKAAMKIDEAHGRTVEKSYKNYCKQNRTYAKSHRGTQQLKGHTLKESLNEYIEDTESQYYLSVEYYLKSMKNFYDRKSNKFLIDKIQGMLKNREIYFINGYVYTRTGFYNLVKNWHGANDIPTTEEQINQIIDSCFKAKAGQGV